MRIRSHAAGLLFLGTLNAWIALPANAQAVGTAFTYQGVLTDGGVAEAGPVNLRFRLYDASTGGSQVGADLVILNQALTNGAFAASLDFGAGAFGGNRRWLEVAVAPVNTSSYNTLTNRQELTATPHSIYAQTAGNATQLSGKPSAYYTSAANLTGTLPSASLAGLYGSAVAFSNLGNTFSGSGSGLKNVPWTGISGAPAFLTTAAVSARLSGDGTAGAPLDLASQGASTGNLLKWNGSVWTPSADALDFPYFRSVTVANGPAFHVVNAGASGYGIGGDTFAQNGAGVSGTASPPSGVAYGGIFVAMSGDAAIGVFGSAYQVLHGIGGSFQAGPGGSGVTARAPAFSGYPGYAGVFNNDNDSGAGVFGASTSSNGSSDGGYFSTNSPFGSAVRGVTYGSGGTGAGGYFQADGVKNCAIHAVFNGSSGGTIALLESGSTLGIGLAVNMTAASGGVIGQFAGHGTSVTGLAVVNDAADGNAAGLDLSWSGSNAIHAYIANTSAKSAALLEFAGPAGSALKAKCYNTVSYAAQFTGRVYCDSKLGVGELNPVDTVELKGTTPEVLYVQNTGTGRGIQAVSTNDTAVWANTTSGSAGVDARTSNGNGYGVVGVNFASTGSAFGVYGDSRSATGYGLYSHGNIGATGTKAFVIDHPLDPDNKLLLHFCAEAPEPLNIYCGNITTGPDGFATVTLPDYFRAINTDVRYQLTVVDEDTDGFVLAKVARKVQDHTFVIRTSQPNIQVSWEIKAVRNDAWVRTNGFQTEQDKPADLKGKYVAPELYGQPAERSMFAGTRETALQTAN